MQFVTRKRRSAPAIIIVSLVDVLLVVLIFLMVASTLKKQPSLKVNLPSTKLATPGGSDKNNAYVVTITKTAPFLHIDGTAVTSDRLQALLIEQVAKNPEVVVQIRPDRGAPIGEVLNVIQIVRDAKIKLTPSLLVLPDKN
jgi:biopolymer transport protein ExbD